jgi:hypothetical protein
LAPIGALPTKILLFFVLSFQLAPVHGAFFVDFKYIILYSLVIKSKGIQMDTDKWKSIVTPKDIYKKIKQDGAERGRTIGSQLKMMALLYDKIKEKLDPKPLK